MLKAIETRYKGYRFRSRLEARWAVFFDAMGTGWEYEKEGFHLHSGSYLPDFWISPVAYRPAHYPQGIPPTPGWWLEIKPAELSAVEESLCKELAEHTGHVVYALAGNIGPGEFISYKWHPSPTGCKGRLNKFMDQGWWHNDTFLYYMCSHAARLRDDDKWPDRKELDAAFRAARFARFEYSELK